MNNIKIGNENDIIFYEDENNNTKVEVRLLDEDVWLNVNAISSLFNVDRSSIVRHISNIYKDEELDEPSTCAKIAQVQTEGRRNVKRTYPYYNLDMIISIGFRVNSKKAIKFRRWANKILKEYIKKAESEYEKYTVIQDKNYISDFDRLIKDTQILEKK